MHRFEISHVFSCTPEAYLGVIDGPAFREGLCRVLELSERALIDQREEPDAVWVKYHVTPARELPAPVRAFLAGKTMAYVEEERRPRDRLLHREWFIHMDSFDAKRFRCEGTFDLEPLGGGEVRRTVRGEIEVRAFGVGGLVERAVAKGIEESYEKTSGLVRELLQSPEILPSARASIP